MPPRKTLETTAPFSRGVSDELQTGLEIFRKIASKLAESPDIDSALGLIMREFCEAASWSLGQVWVPKRKSDGREILECGPGFYSAQPSGELFRTASFACTFARGQGLPGQAWATRSVAWMPEFDKDGVTPRAQAASHLGLHAGVALPVISDGDVVAIVEFLMPVIADSDRSFGEIAQALMPGVADLLRRLATESALRTSEERFASFMRHVPAAAFIRDSHGRYVFVNAFIEQVTGRKLQDWIGKTDAELGTTALELVETDHVVLGEKRSVSRTLRTAGPGGPRWWIVTKFPLQGEGAVPMVGGISLEITDQKKAEETARQKDRQLGLLIEHIRDYAIYMLDTKGNVTSWNRGAHNLKGYAAEEVIGHHFSRFFPADEVASKKPDRLLDMAAAEGRAEDEGFRVRKDGSRFWAFAIITAIRDESGTLLGFAKITRDLTERKREEENRLLFAQAQEALRVREEFLSFASHEMRTPLTNLQLQLELLRSDKDLLSSQQQTQAVARMERAYERLRELVESFLQHSRLQSGRLVLQPESADLRALCREVVEEASLQAQRKGLELILELTAEPCIARTDRRFVRVIAMNLVGNAVKFSERGKIRLTLSSRNGEIRIAVRDQGPGIAPEDQRRIFEPFERIEPLAYKHIPGVGLGLAIARRMAETIGARIELESQQGVGSTFSLVLPAKSMRAPV